MHQGAVGVHRRLGDPILIEPALVCFGRVMVVTLLDDGYHIDYTYETVQGLATFREIQIHGERGNARDYECVVVRRVGFYMKTCVSGVSERIRMGMSTRGFRGIGCH